MSVEAATCHLSTVDSTYVTDDDRFVVMFAASYGQSEGDNDSGVSEPSEAAARAILLTRDAGRADTQWVVLDRSTGKVYVFEQEDFLSEPGA
jgi:hypothetical protein